MNVEKIKLCTVIHRNLEEKGVEKVENCRKQENNCSGQKKLSTMILEKVDKWVELYEKKGIYPHFSTIIEELCAWKREGSKKDIHTRKKVGKRTKNT